MRGRHKLPGEPWLLIGVNVALGELGGKGTCKMPVVRTGTGAKWARRAGNAGEEYKSGVLAPRNSWSTMTLAASAAQAAGVQAAIRDKRFEKGVSAAGDAKWSKGASSKGPGRFSEGVGLGQSDYEKGVEPYLETIRGITLPARGPKGDLRNLDRVKAIAVALRNKKLSM